MSRNVGICSSAQRTRLRLRGSSEARSASASSRCWAARHGVRTRGGLPRRLLRSHAFDVADEAIAVEVEDELWSTTCPA